MKIRNSHNNQKIQDILKELNFSEKIELFGILSQEISLKSNNDSLLKKLEKAPKITDEDVKQFREARNYVSKLAL